MPPRPLQLPDALPTEVWEHILCELPVSELNNCMVVCRKFAEIIVYQRIRYDNKLVENALVDGEDSEVPLRTRLDMVRRYHRAWEELSFPMEGGEEVVHFISSHVHNAPAPVFHQSGWLSMIDKDRGLRFMTVPTLSSPKQPPTNHNDWSFAHRLQASLLPEHNSYRFDPSQDLILFLNESQDNQCSDIHVRSLSTGLQHPLAQSPTLAKSKVVIIDPNSFRIHEELCAVLARKDVMQDEMVLHVWDWQTGKLLLVESGFHAWGDVISFLGDRTLLVVHDECLQLHVFDEDNGHSTFTLELPHFHEDALQIWTTVSQPYGQAEPGRAFACDPASEVVVINMVRAFGNPQQPQTKTSILLAIRVASLLECADDASESVPVPWDDWGPGCTRFFRVPDTCSWEAPTTFGSRVLIPYHLEGVPTLALIDFGVDGAHVGSPTYETSPGWTMSLCEAPTLDDYSQWFEDDCKLVKSDVPCRIRYTKLHNLPARLVGATLFENGFMLKVANAHQCDYMTMMMDM